MGLVHRALDDDLELVKSLLDTMHKTGADFTNTFRTLNQIPIPEHERDTRECGNQFLQLLLNQTSDATRIAQKCAPRIPAAYAIRSDPPERHVALTDFLIDLLAR